MLGVGLAAALAAVTLVLAATGRLGLYINPDSTWFAVSMAVVALAGAVLSFALPLGAEADHPHPHLHAPLRGARSLGGRGPSHDHGDARGHAHAPGPVRGGHAPGPVRRGDASDDRANGQVRGGHAAGRHVHPGHASDDPRDDDAYDVHDRHASDGDDHASAHDHAGRGAGILPATAAVVGGVLAAGVVATIVIVPPATLSAELAMSRDTGSPPLFQGADDIALAATGDTSSFRIGEWASVFATTTNPEAFDGDPVTLTGFVAPADDGGFQLARLVITHCVIDAQPASIPIAAKDAPATGEWVTVTGTVRDVGGRLEVRPASVERVDEPKDPYEY